MKTRVFEFKWVLFWGLLFGIISIIFYLTGLFNLTQYLVGSIGSSITIMYSVLGLKGVFNKKEKEIK